MRQHTEQFVRGDEMIHVHARTCQPDIVSNRIGKLHMTVLLGAVVSFVLFMIVGVSGVQAASGKVHCSSLSRAGTGTVCRTVPAQGSFTVPIPGTSAELVGSGTPDRSGQAIVLARTQPICRGIGGFGLRITTPGTTKLLPPLRWSSGTLYAPAGRSGSCHIVVSPALAAAPGLYQVAPGTPSGVARMPGTGGGAAASVSSNPTGYIPDVGAPAFMLLLLMFAASRARSL